MEGSRMAEEKKQPLKETVETEEVESTLLDEVLEQTKLKPSDEG